MATMASAQWRGRKWDYLIAVHGKQNPTDAEWEEICRLFRQTDSPERVRGLALTIGGSPNRRQRARLAEAMRHAEIPTGLIAVAITDSAVVRGIIASFTWIGMVLGMRAFPLGDLHDALDYLGVAHEEKADLLAALERLGEGVSDGNPVKIALDRAGRRVRPAVRRAGVHPFGG
jgi:hypothetical protein